VEAVITAEGYRQPATSNQQPAIAAGSPAKWPAIGDWRLAIGKKCIAHRPPPIAHCSLL